jgi:tetratricopeptide (TPR) repeat protein
MKKNRILMVVVTILLGVTPLAGQADELFDTKAAAQHIEQGIALLKAKNIDDAINEFEESASISPEAEAYYYLGYALYLKGRTGDEESRKLSRENFEKAYEIDPNFTPARSLPADPAPVMSQPGAAPEATQPVAPSSPVVQPDAQKPAETQPSEQPKQ